MPSGIPVATVAIDGGANAALLACEIIALGEPELSSRLEEKRRHDTDAVMKRDAEVADRLI